MQRRLVQSNFLYGKFDDAIELHLRFFGSPGDADALIGKGRLDEAEALLQKSVKETPGDLRSRSRLALISALRGKFPEAEKAIPSIIEQARNNRAYITLFTTSLPFTRWLAKPTKPSGGCRQPPTRGCQIILCLRAIQI